MKILNFEKITEYTHHLNMHLEKSDQSEEGTISIDWPSSQIQSDQDSMCVIKIESSQQDQNGQIDSNICKNNETSLNSKLHVQVDLENSQKLEPFPSSTSYDKSFGTKLDLTMQTNPEQGLFISCTLCGQSFSQRQALNRHLETAHTGEIQPYLCNLCDVSFAKKDEMTLHNNIVHPKPFSCTFCDKTFSTNSNLSRHVERIHKKLKTFSCTLCDKSFSHKGDLTAHVNKIHNVNEKSESLVQIDDDHQVFKSELSLPTHDTRTHHDNNVIKTEPLFLQDDKYMIKTQKPFACTLCDKSFTQKGQLFQHVAAVHQKSFLCTLCDKSFCTKYYLTAHINAIHKKLKPFSCTLCDKSFAEKGHLKRHFDAVHRKLRKPKSFSCTFCDATYSTKSYLSEHMDRMHEKRKTFSCTVCEKSFMFEDNLIFHQQIHGHGQTSPAMKQLDTNNCGDNIKDT